MSNEEQVAIAGRLVIERAETQKRIALLHAEIGRIAGWVMDAAAPLITATIQPREWAASLVIIRGLIETRAVEQLKSHLEEYERATARYDTLQEQLRLAGLL
jgi:hypothetical protein